MTALEKAARAACEAEGETMGRSLDEIDFNPYKHSHIARAVLMAVRDLPDEIIDEHLYSSEYGTEAYYFGWQPAIDAILAEPDQ